MPTGLILESEGHLGGSIVKAQGIATFKDTMRSHLRRSFGRITCKNKESALFRIQIFADLKGKFECHLQGIGRPGGDHLLLCTSDWQAWKANCILIRKGFASLEGEVYSYLQGSGRSAR